MECGAPIELNTDGGFRMTEDGKAFSRWFRENGFPNDQYYDEEAVIMTKTAKTTREMQEQRRREITLLLRTVVNEFQLMEQERRSVVRREATLGRLFLKIARTMSKREFGAWLDQHKVKLSQSRIYVSMIRFWMRQARRREDLRGSTPTPPSWDQKPTDQAVAS